MATSLCWTTVPTPGSSRPGVQPCCRSGPVLPASGAAARAYDWTLLHFGCTVASGMWAGRRPPASTQRPLELQPASWTPLWHFLGALFTWAVPSPAHKPWPLLPRWAVGL